MHQLTTLLEISSGNWLLLAGLLLLTFILGWFAGHYLGGHRQQIFRMEKEIDELKVKNQELIVESINRYESLENKYIRLQGNYTTAVNEAMKLSDALVKNKELLNELKSNSNLIAPGNTNQESALPSEGLP